MEKKKWTVCTFIVVVFAMLAAIYAIDPNRFATARRMSPVGSHSSRDYMLSSLNVTAIAQDRNQLVWVGTSAGINVVDGKEYIQFFHDANDSTALPDDYINCLHLDRRGRMWVGTQNGVARYEGGYRFRRFDLPLATHNIREIYDASGTSDTAAVVVSDGKGSYMIDGNDNVVWTATRVVRPRPNIVPDDTVALYRPKDIIAATFVDADRNVWIGYRNAGYQVLSSNIIAYKHANANPLARATATHDMVGMATVEKYVLAGTTRRLYIYDTQGHTIANTLYSDIFESSPEHRQDLNNVVPYDGNKAWVVGNRQIASCLVTSGRVAAISRAYAYNTGSRQIGCGTRLGDCLYAPNANGYLLKYKFGSNRADSIAIHSTWFDDETQLVALSDATLLLFMRNMQLATLNTHNGKLTPLKTNSIDNAGNIDPAFVRTDSHGNVWLGTKRSGLYRLDLRNNTVRRMPFPRDVHIQALAEDRQGQIWITTLKDVVCYQPQTGAVLKNSLASSSQGLENRQFFDNSMCLAPDGNIVLGSSNGCVFLPPSVATDNVKNSDLCIYAFDVKKGDGSVLALNDKFTDESTYTFAHDENNVTFRFFYPNYARRSSLMYQYMLDGYDRTWSEPTYENAASFANLAPGKYTFRVRLVSSPDLPPIAERCISFDVKCAPWQSAAAWMLYIICIVAAVYYINSLYLRIRTNSLRLAQEQREREREQHANEMNMSFFANISHEFRNPLTLIAGPLIALRSDSTLPATVRQSLRSVCLSVNRMLRLIDQMLDFNQLETDALRLKVVRMDAASELRRVAEQFEDSARVRGIRLEVDIAGDDYDMLLDTDKFEKIMSNLFTNALKHTPDNGRIAIGMRTETNAYEGDYVVVSVFNTGSHIADNRLPDVFKRYFQLTDANASHKYGWGTGIGLYYVKRLVGLHHGEISVNNVGDGTDAESDGVQFRFALPMCNVAYDGEEIAAEPSRVMQIPLDVMCEEKKEADEKAKNAKEEEPQHHRPKILVVDDDVDVAAYIRSLFASDYIVENRYSAEAALADMADIRPDIILSDIIMGEMSGYDFCRTLKSDLMYSHIPVVLITAKSNIDEQISGLKLGAVAYVTKPFDPAYLHALVESQLANVRNLRQRLGDSTSTESLAADMSDQDRHFMDELYALMERHSAELDLNVSTVCRDLLISQSKFNYKLKELTGDTPGVFFRKYKLNRAARLLREGKHNVSEVAVLTGFGTAAHFSVAFKKQFGVVPSEYV